MIFTLRPVYAKVVIGIKEKDDIYKFVEALVQLITIKELKAQRHHISNEAP